MTFEQQVILSKLESDIASMGDEAWKYSIAISFKRMADQGDKMITAIDRQSDAIQNLSETIFRIWQHR